MYKPILVMVSWYLNHAIMQWCIMQWCIYGVFLYGVFRRVYMRCRYILLYGGEHVCITGVYTCEFMAVRVCIYRV